MDSIYFFRTKKGFVLFFLPVLLLFYGTATAALAGQFQVVRIYDGDTVKVSGHDVEFNVRLVGIDAPETQKRKGRPGQPFGQNSKDFLSRLVLNRQVTIHGYGLDPFNRILGVLFSGPLNINLEMIRSGLAEAYRGEPPKNLNMKTFFLKEEEAKRSGRGIWSLGAGYISPSDWRKRNKG